VAIKGIRGSRPSLEKKKRGKKNIKAVLSALVAVARHKAGRNFELRVG